MIDILHNFAQTASGAWTLQVSMHTFVGGNRAV